MFFCLETDAKLELKYYDSLCLYTVHYNVHISHDRIYIKSNVCIYESLLLALLHLQINKLKENSFKTTED